MADDRCGLRSEAREALLAATRQRLAIAVAAGILRRRCRRDDEAHLEVDEVPTCTAALSEATPAPTLAVTSDIVDEIVALKANIERSIENAQEIKDSLDGDYRSAMDSLLQRMITQCDGWTRTLNTASKNLINSTALIENLENITKLQSRINVGHLDSEHLSDFEATSSSTPCRSDIEPNRQFNSMTADRYD